MQKWQMKGKDVFGKKKKNSMKEKAEKH